MKRREVVGDRDVGISGDELGARGTRLVKNKVKQKGVLN